MTTEEIRKEAINYDRELKTHPMSAETLREDLVRFGQIVNKHWQEKTRWIPVEEKLPLRQSRTRQILAKNKHAVSVVFISCTDEGYLNSLESLKREFTHWKEIEL